MAQNRGLLTHGQLAAAAYDLRGVERSATDADRNVGRETAPHLLAAASQWPEQQSVPIRSAVVVYQEGNSPRWTLFPFLFPRELPETSSCKRGPEAVRACR